jgi:anaphase-promoting complex subunit 3
MHRTTLFPNSNAATNHNAPATAGFETPNLTPIPNEQSFAAANTRAVQRARKVVFRDYYQPSPENTSYSNNKPRSLFFSGLDASDVAAIAATPVSQQHTSLFSAAGAETELSNPNTNIAARPGLSVVPRQRPNYGSEGDHVTSQTGEIPSYDAVQCILQLLCLMGTAQWHLGHFRSKHAIQLFERLPEEQYNTGWVLHQVGRAHFAMADYANAIRSLQLMEQVEPHRMAGLEVLSTALWQTKREVDLSHLAQRVADFDRLSAEVWCVVGNCFSLQKEHETALTFFRRSIQLDPSFTYSHTLSGHEYFANEDFDKAIACYRDAIRADERHYNAWYGLGAVYYRQEKFDLAEYHFHRACSINPQSSVLICHLGMAQNANGKQYESLDTLQAAFRLDPHNPQAHYQRSLVFQALDRNEEALMELVKVRDAAPREAQIYYSMGRLYKKLGRTEKAMRCFLDALDLDPKDTNLIKSAMEKMDEPDVEEEISAF